MLRSLLFLFISLCPTLIWGQPMMMPSPQSTEVRIGVLALRGDVRALEQWVPTANYLSEQIPEHHFRIVPLDFEAIGPAVERGEVNFVLANSAIYVTLEARHGISRIATMRNRVGERANTRFGGVIFSRADNEAVQDLDDLRGQHFGAVMSNSFGGWLMGWYELRRQGLEPKKSFASVQFLGTHDAVVYAVLDGLVAGGTVRTDTLERMADEGKLDLARIRVLAARHYPEFDYLISTDLYPEWPIARVRGTPEALGHQVALELMQMPADSAAALAGEVLGWTVPLDYQPVHDMMRELRVGPYADLGRITPADLWRYYWHWILLGLLLLMGISGVALYIARLNHRLRLTEQDLIKVRDGLADQVAGRTAELEHTMRELLLSHQRLERVSRDWNDAFDAISDPIFIHDRQMTIISANPAYCRAAGKGLEALLGQPYTEVFPRLPEPLPACRHFPEQWGEQGDEVALENGEVYVSSSFAIQKADGTVEHAIHILKNVTEQRRSEQEMTRLNRALRTLSLCNTSLVHAEEEPALLERICRILVDSSGYRFAWVAYGGHGAEALNMVAHAGFDNGLVPAIEKQLQAAQRLPATVALERGYPYIERQGESNPSSSPEWRQQASQFGCVSILAFPLNSSDECYGTISIHSGEPDAFDEAEMLLLNEMAGDLAFGIRTLRSRVAREQAERNLALTEARYEELYEYAPNAYLSISVDDGRLTQFNPALPEMLGLERGDLEARPLLELFVEGEEGRDRASELLAEVRRGKAVRDQELQMRHANGSPVWVSLSVLPVTDGDDKIAECRASLIDISARKHAEGDRQRFAEQLQRSLLQTIRAIALTIEKRDPYTAGHQERVADLAVAIGGRMGLDKDRLEGIRLGAMIHDIGKVSVPSEILNRPGRLEPELFNIIKAHPSTGYEIISGIEFPWPLAEMVVQHHERLDGSGYPAGLKGEQILLESRILAVADVVEAMASHRPYRAALGPEAALAEIQRGKGEQYDTEVVDACQTLFDEGKINWIDGRLD